MQTKANKSDCSHLGPYWIIYLHLDLNQDPVRDKVLSLACLPIPSYRHTDKFTYKPTPEVIKKNTN